jgi:Cu/Ag efflux protein CusF
MNRMLTSVVMVLAVALLLGTASSVLAADKATGKIKIVRAGTQQFVLTDKAGKDWTFRMDENAKVRLNDKNSELKELKAGDEVEVTYTKKGDQLIATQVTCKRS